MDKVLAVFQWLQGPAGVALLGGLFALSEAIGAIPGVKASGVFQAVYNALSFLKGKLTPPKA